MNRADVLVVGAGIAGLQSAVDLADMGRKVLLVESTSSIGGRMINLSKVYPTLDCASCITTPKMSAAAKHPLIHAMTYSEVEHIKKNEQGFFVTIRKKARFIVEEDCIGCKRCEDVCPVYIEDEFEHGMGAKKAIAIPFTNAIPQYPVLSMQNCILCGRCAKVCPKNCIDFMQKDEILTYQVESVVVATGYQLTPMDRKKQYGAGKLKNVISSLQAERLLAPHGPFGRVLRPSDGKRPSSIAYVQCAGSRDKSIGVPYCSRICCMAAIKQAMLLSGSLPIADITIYYMDIRAFGKGYEQFYQTAKAMGILFVKAKVAKIAQTDEDDLLLRIEQQETDASPTEVRHDLVVLSQGMLPQASHEMLERLLVTSGDDGFVKTEAAALKPLTTTTAGVFVAGTANSPKDIVDSIMEASAVAVKVEAYLKQRVEATS